MYDETFYDTIRDGCISSANKVAPNVVAYHAKANIKSVIDIGCGEGHWGAAFVNLVNCCGTFIDNDGYDSPKRCYKGVWHKVDIATEELPLATEHYDLAICLEVAEHLPESRADSLVAHLTYYSETVLFSAAIPGQGGWGHINEQWPNYWVHKFNALGYTAEFIGLDYWGDDAVEPWYQQNLYVFNKMKNGGDNYRQNFTPMIHPAFWATRTGVSYP